MHRTAVTIMLAALCLVWLCPAANAQTEDRKLTIMVYMCGSNLESSGGSATEDIQEMMAYVPEGKDITLLVMTGGSDVRAGGTYFSPDSTGVYEIASGGRVRKLPDSPSGANMGDGETLASFLRFCQETRPAERYALILWDHGGGPLEGVCWDENNDMDHLTIEELTGALGEALNGKLEWIGFDACLMASLEVAGFLAPYADYMIASQETEPPFGWNYSFLGSLDPAAGGAEAGRLIVDAYFAGQENTSETLTLACIDLGKAEAAIEALDPVFLPLSRTLDHETYMDISARRMKTTGFGKALPDISSSGYDLVDLRDLVNGMAPTEETALLLEKLDEAVVYSRANGEGAYGLTVYYPYENKARYQKEWRERYAAMPFSTGYHTYVEAFGRILTGEQLMKWRSLVPTAGMPEADGSCLFELPLTPEQARNVVSAQVMIIRDSFYNQLSYNSILLATCGAELGEDYVLRGRWDGRCLYAETENGDVGPISFRQTNDGTKNIVSAYYVLEGNLELQGEVAQLELDAENLPEYPEVNRIIVWDEATESYSSRNRFSEEGFGRVYFWTMRKNYPGVGEDMALPSMTEWGEEHLGYSIPGLMLPQAWRLHMVPYDSGRQLYAVFRLVDSQQQVICSIPVAMPNPYRTVFTPVSGTVEEDSLRVSMTASIDTSPDREGLHLEWAFHNSGDRKTSIRIIDPVINENRMTGSFYVTAYENNTTYSDTHLTFHEIAGLDHIDSVSGILEAETDGEEPLQVPFRFDFSGADLSAAGAPEPLSQTEQDGVRMTLLGIEPGSFSRLKAYVLVENGSGEDLTADYIMVNRLAFFVLTSSGSVPAGKSRVLTLEASNECAETLLDIQADTAGQVTYLEYYLLQAMGYREISEVALAVTMGTDLREFSLPLREPLPLADTVPIINEGVTYPVWNPPDDLAFPPRDRLPVLAENDEIRIRLRRAVTGLNEIALCVEIENKSDRMINMDSGDGTVNGQPAKLHFFGNRVPPHSVRVVSLLIDNLTMPGEEAAIREIGISLYDRGCYSSSDAVTATVIPESPVPLGVSGGFWLNGDSFVTVPAVLPMPPVAEQAEPVPVDPAFPIARDLAVPEDPDAYEITLDSGLSPEDAAGATECRAAVVRKTAEGYLQVLTIQDLAAEEEGRFVLHHPGMILVAEEDPSIGVMTYLESGTDGSLEGNARMGMSLMTDAWETINLRSISWRLDRNTGTAEIVSMEQDLIPAEPLVLSDATFLTAEFLPETRDDGTMPHISDTDMRNDFEWFLNAPSVTATKPVRLMLRPVTPEDGLYVMFSVALADGTRCALPLVPYPVK